MGEFRVVLADARPVRRQRLGHLLRAQPGLQLVGACPTLMEAYSLIETEVPDAVLTCQSMRTQPEHAMYAEMMRILGVSALSLDDDGSDEDVLASLARFRQHQPLPRPPVRSAAPAAITGLTGGDSRPPVGPERIGAVIVIGASTGGVEALHRLVSELPADCPPVMIVQHIRGSFSGAFAERLNRASAARVREAEDGLPLARGQVVVAPGNELHLEIGGPRPLACRLTAGDTVSGHRPSVDALFRSAVPLGRRAVGVLLTGMGQDGARGLLALREAGAHTIAQDRATATVYGMPRVAAEIGAAAEVLPLDRIGSAMIAAARMVGEIRP